MNCCFSFTETKRDGRTKSRIVGDPCEAIMDLGMITPETSEDHLKWAIETVLNSTMSLDDRITLIHLICHSAKYAGLVRSGSI